MTDEELMRAYVAGDHGAFRELHRRYFPSLNGLVRRHVASEEEAREIVQQTFFQLHVARRDFRPDKKLRPWLFTIAMNLVRQHYRKRGRRKETALADAPPQSDGADTARPLERAEQARRLRDALAKLPDGQREVIELHWLQERPFAEVAAIVGASEGAVRVRAHRGYARLRELLEPAQAEGEGGS